MQKTRSAIPPRAHATRPVEQEECYTRPLQEQKKSHPLTSLGVGMLIAFLGYVIFMSYVLPFFTDKYDNWHYGDARISSLDANINGRHDHFIAEVLHGKVIIIDIRNDDASKTIVFVSPQVTSNDHALITLSTADVNNNGRTDIVVHVQDVDMDAVLFSTGNSFQWSVPK